MDSNDTTVYPPEINLEIEEAYKKKPVLLKLQQVENIIQSLLLKWKKQITNYRKNTQSYELQVEFIFDMYLSRVLEYVFFYYRF